MKKIVLRLAKHGLWWQLTLTKEAEMLKIVTDAVRRFEELVELLRQEGRQPTASEKAEIDTLIPRVLCAMREGNGEEVVTGGSARDAWITGRTYSVVTL